MVGGFDLYTQNTRSPSSCSCQHVSDRAARWRLVRYNDAAHLAGVT